MASHDKNYSAGEAKGQAQVKVDQMMGKGREATKIAKDGANTAKDKVVDTAEATRGQAQSAGKTAVPAKDKTGGLLQQTGDQVMNMAMGATDAVKHTLGIGCTEPVKTGEATKGQAQKGIDQAGSYLKEKTEATKGTAQSARKTAVAEEEKTGGLLQQTGGQVKNMAVGATNAVKNTLGFGGTAENTTTKD
ncbi:hypothetical protein HHK36_006087 [Tetracentron sinense]|uniref:Uncharacterized protein n=1 Tax=Tetracentron sinense TaxID=13715 RepID=A0A835DKJ4_TETSI|nr:hypothetical protein HHK36_006087 [Tetracentron sinense]